MPEECDTLNEHLFDGQRPCPNLPPGMIEVQGGRGRWIMIKKSDQPPLVAGDNLTLYTGAVNRKSGALVMQGDPGTWTPANSGRAEGGGRGRVLAVSREEGERSVCDGPHSLTTASPPTQRPRRHQVPWL